MSPLTLASLLNITGNGVRDQLVDDVLQVGGGHLAADDVDHLLADVSHLHHQELESIYDLIIFFGHTPAQPGRRQSSWWTAPACV